MFTCIGIYMAQLFLGYYIFDTLWLPCKDLEIGIATYLNITGSIMVFCAICRQLLIAVIIFSISIKQFDNKDVISFEK